MTAAHRHTLARSAAWMALSVVDARARFRFVKATGGELRHIWARTARGYERKIADIARQLIEAGRA